jgi:hypothetical protein
MKRYAKEEERKEKYDVYNINNKDQSSITQGLYYAIS